MQHVMVHVPDWSDAEQVMTFRGRIRAARKAALEGTDFGLVARTYSEGRFREQGGDMGWIHGGGMAEPASINVWVEQE